MGLKQNQQLLEQYPVLEFFQYSHLPEELQPVSAPFNTIAWKLVKKFADTHELRKALDRLLEAKDASVRAAFSPRLVASDEEE